MLAALAPSTVANPIHGVVDDLPASEVPASSSINTRAVLTTANGLISLFCDIFEFPLAPSRRLDA